MRRALWLLCLLSFAGCDRADDPREATVVEAIRETDELFIRSRPRLAHGKYVRMARSLYAFYRGSVPLFRSDVADPTLEVGYTDYPARGPFPLSIGDAHPENFGTLRGADGVFAIEPNDFDSADRYPYHWELRRLTVGMVLASRLTNERTPEARARTAEAAPAIVAATARAYAEAALAFADGAPRTRMTEDAFEMPAIFVDLFERSRGDLEDREELEELTVLEGGARRLRRGNVDSDEPENVYQDVPQVVTDDLPRMFDEYRRSLIDPPEPAFFEVLDAARELGSGVASWPRVRVIVLVRGSSDDPDDDFVFEVKELTDSGAAGRFPQGVYADDVGDRIVTTSRQAWAVPDAEPFWGAASLVGIPVQIRQEAEMFKTLRVERMNGVQGTPEDLTLVGRRLGWLLARIHAADAPGAEQAIDAIAEAIRGDVDGFVAQEQAVALAYADRVEADWERFRRALRRLGPRLGLPVDPNEYDRVSPELRALYGTPVPPPEVE
ncbi:MAG TPA: DUF2252 family protein [Sandaracinaceae bacterium LLY-WYZ-13_1]|nr:DUF2252 family protein [Sandaracinaceae bacterium LLY-WYZ-13_1]